MSPAVLQASLSVLRSVLIALGAFLVSKGLITAEGTESLVGAALVVITALAGVWQKFSSERQAEAREVVAVHVGLVVADATIGPTNTIPPIRVPEVIEAIKPRIRIPDQPDEPTIVLPVTAVQGAI